MSVALMPNKLKQTLTLSAMLVVFFTGCVRNNPIFRKLAEREDARRIKWTDEQIAKSPELQELDHLCTKTIPVFAGFELKSRFAAPSKKFLTYHYHSSAQFDQVKSFYIDYFSSNGWCLTRQHEHGWGPDQLEFAKQPYRVVLSHGGLGAYAFDCIKTSGL